MKKCVVVLGCGLVGRAMAVDLHRDYQVTVVDIDEMVLRELSREYGITTRALDLSGAGAIAAAVQDADLVVGSLPGFMGYRAAEQVIAAGKDMVDISFFPEDPFSLDEPARRQGVTVVVDCGVAPGMSNIILGYHNRQMEVERYRCLVGGLPVKREWPWQYKAVFSPIDVIEEYTRPARYVENGQLVVREALSDAELVDFDAVGTLEAWNSDGLRSLAQTMKIPNMIEKTLRYPGSIEYLKVLRAGGFFSYDEVDVKGRKVRPIDLTARLLFPQWQMQPDDEDFTVMKIEIEGKENGKPKKYVYDLYDRFDRTSGTPSMSRTTGYTCTAVVNLMLQAGYRRSGLNPPEYVGEKTADFRFVLDYLKERGVVYKFDSGQQ
ncbi:MAG: saccharopine dehydrogenase C-terminal domain-containing protein [Candidatus Neomarinimicrobiota bacterium]